MKNELIRRISQLLTVKTLVTLSVIWTLCSLIKHGITIPDKFYDIALIIISFYFGTQSEKGEKNENRKN